MQTASRITAAMSRIGSFSSADAIRLKTSVRAPLFVTVISVLVGFGQSAGAVSNAISIDFVVEDDRNGTGVDGFYQARGFTTPNLRFHDASREGNVSFPFVDEWGAVVDFGLLGTATAFINFVDPIAFVRIDAVLLDTSLAGIDFWSMTAFDLGGNEVGFASALVEHQGLEPIQVDPVSGEPLSTQRFSVSTLTISAQDATISALVIEPTTKFGIDTLLLVPEPGTAALVGIGLLLLANRGRR